MKDIPLTNSRLKAFVDDEDYPLLSRHTWRIDDAGYAIADIIRMHVLIMGRKAGCVVDHIDRCKLNNQKANLRLVNHRHNALNKGAHKDCTSGFKGVRRRIAKLAKPWSATIRQGSKALHLGYFSNAEDAARAYDAKARELHGQYAYQNFPEVSA